MKESESYRDNYEALLNYFGGRMLLTQKDVAEYCRKDRRTVARLYCIGKDGITLPTLARRMSR